MYNVLVVDFSIFKNSIAKMFRSSGYSVELCESAFDAMKKLKAIDFDLVISEVELPGNNAFDLYRYIMRNYPYIPTIMTTEKSIDTFFDFIFEEGIGNILCKPIKKVEILGLAEKLITKKNIFGLGHYLTGILETKKIQITSSRQIKKATAVIIDKIKNWGFKIKNENTMSLILNEMIINAVYHSHGLTGEKEQRHAVHLREGERVDVFFARAEDKYGIAIDDYNGKLSKMTILDTLNKVIKQNILLNEALESNTDVSQVVSEKGRGIDIVRKLVGECYFIIEKDTRTEVILLFDMVFDNDATAAYSSLKIIETPPKE